MREKRRTASQTSKEQVRPEFRDIEEEYNRNIALMLQNYLDRWLLGVTDDVEG
jgi:hypothetical protein